MPEKIEPYNLERAQEKGEKPRGKIESGEASNYQGAQEKLEQEAEQAKKEEFEKRVAALKEHIRDVVLDIDKEGLAYAVLDRQIVDVEKILSEGLLPLLEGRTSENSGRRQSFTPGNLRQEEGHVHFNITGRAMDMKDEYRTRFRKEHDLREMIASEYNARGKWEWPEEINPQHTIIFDISHFKELPPDSRLKNRTFTINTGARTFKEMTKHHDATIDEMGRPMPVSEWGFKLSHRVSPRLFLGLIACPTVNDHDFLNRLERFFAANPDKILPVYNRRGDLAWPQRIEHEKIKKIVAERESGEEKVKDE